jgi:hypothetical protein
MSAENDEYIRLLDSLARFYNSEVTVHVGYLLTLAVVFFTLLTLVSQRLTQGLPLWEFIEYVILAFSGLCVLMYPVFRYAVARYFYYSALSEIVWQHMGLQGHETKWLDALKTRATRSGTREGIHQSIMTMFEARLYISQCFRNGLISETPAAPESPQEKKKAEILRNLRNHFGFQGIERNLLSRNMMYFYFRGDIFFLSRTALLMWAYHWQIGYYRKQKHSCQQKGMKRKPCERCIGCLLSAGSLCDDMAPWSGMRPKAAYSETL